MELTTEIVRELLDYDQENGRHECILVASEKVWAILQA